MKICHTKQELRATLTELRRTGSIGLVPTMGYLHDGHMSLVQHALQENAHTVASIFVNPTQFGNDLTSYPRALEDDLTLLRDAGVAAVFTPTPDIMYHDEAQTIVETTDLANKLMGALRPGHFRGVATIVTKLFNLFQPDRAYFGEKDFQQLAVIRIMVRDLDIPVIVRGVPTVRHDDGLAMSLHACPPKRARQRRFCIKPALPPKIAWQIGPAQKTCHSLFMTGSHPNPWPMCNPSISATLKHLNQ